jgi:hypothetical protein
MPARLRDEISGRYAGYQPGLLIFRDTSADFRVWRPAGWDTGRENHDTPRRNVAT